MNYEQLEIYFGSPGTCHIFPTNHLNIRPTQAELSLLATHAIHEFPRDIQWQTVFAILRREARKFKRKNTIPLYRYLVLRTGILHPTSAEGAPYRGHVLATAIDITKPIGPGQMVLFAHHMFRTVDTFSHWSELPKGFPLPVADPLVPLDLVKEWFDGCASYQPAPLAQPVVLGANSWEELL